MQPEPTTPRIPALSPGATVGVVAPASAPAEESDLTQGLMRIRAEGLSVVPFFDSSRSEGYLADSDTRRLAYINEAFASQDIGAIFCVRGGYGSLRILDRIDFGALADSPKVVVGYSDVTAIHLAVLAMTGLPGLSAAMVATDWKDIDPTEVRSILAHLSGTARDGLFADRGVPLRTVKPGKAEGRLIGGNLSILGKLVGTPYLPDLTGAILFVEEVGEPVYRIDGLFAQLQLSGLLDRIAGLVVGGITGSDPEPGKPSLSLSDVLEHYAVHINGPVASGLQYGHFQPKLPMPVGIRGRLTADESSAHLEALEQLTRA